MQLETIITLAMVVCMVLCAVNVAKCIFDENPKFISFILTLLFGSLFVALPLVYLSRSANPGKQTIKSSPVPIEERLHMNIVHTINEGL